MNVARVALGQLEREPHGAVRALARGREDDLRAVELEQLHALRRCVLRHDAGERVALELGDHRERDAGVAARRLEQLAARLELAGGLGRLDHRHRDAILDRARRVLALELRVEPHAAVRREPRQLDERRRSDRARGGEGVSDALAAGHRRQEDHRRALPTGVSRPCERAHVLVVDVDVDERRDLVPAVEHLAAEPGKALGQVVQHLAHRAARGLDLARAADLGAERRRDADSRSRATCAGRPCAELDVVDVLGDRRAARRRPGTRGRGEARPR